jgi:hypothetical protein
VKATASKTTKGNTRERAEWYSGDPNFFPVSVRLRKDSPDSERLDRLTKEHGTRSNVLREGMRVLDDDRRRQAEREAIVKALRAWAEDGGDPWMIHCADRIAAGEHLTRDGGDR